jgi:DNA-binding Lrp family transcriptional regulator
MARLKKGPKKPVPLPQAAAAYTEVEPELDQVTADELKPISIDIPYAVSLVLGLLPGLRELRPEIVKQLPAYPIDLFDRLEMYALATWYVHVMSQPPSPVQNPLKKLLEDGVALRLTLLSDAEALAKRDLVSAQTVADIRSGAGNYDTANDLVALYALLSGAWENIENKTAVTIEEINSAGELGTAILAALGQQEKGTLARPVVTERRKRAFTLFVKAYDEVQRAVCYLRWHEGDADEIAPSIYKGRGGRPSPRSDSVTDKPASTTPETLVTPPA